MNIHNGNIKKQIELFNLSIVNLINIHSESRDQAESLIRSIDYIDLLLREHGYEDDLDEELKEERARAMIFINRTTSIKSILKTEYGLKLLGEKKC